MRRISGTYPRIKIILREYKLKALVVLFSIKKHLKNHPQNLKNKREIPTERPLCNNKVRIATNNV